MNLFMFIYASGVVVGYDKVIFHPLSKQGACESHCLFVIDRTLMVRRYCMELIHFLWIQMTKEDLFYVSCYLTAISSFFSFLFIIFLLSSFTSFTLIFCFLIIGDKCCCLHLFLPLRLLPILLLLLRSRCCYLLL